MAEVAVQRILKEYFENLYNIYIPKNMLHSTCVALMEFKRQLFRRRINWER